MFLKVNIRPENRQDSEAINEVIRSAFENHPYSNHKEQFIVDQLRADAALSVSLVAEYEGNVIGHIAFSKVKIGSKECFWYGLAPVSVSPEYQKSGVGSQLIKAGIEAIKQQGARGCVLLGDPDYYERFGFKANDSLTLEGVPPEFFLSLSFTEALPSGKLPSGKLPSGKLPTGKVDYHQAFADNG